MKRVKHVHKPTWLTDEIILAIHKRDKLHKRGKEYKVLRNKINVMIKKKAKRTFLTMLSKMARVPDIYGIK